MNMVYIVNVFDKKTKDIVKSFEVLSADEAGALDTAYSVLGFDVSVEPDVMAYLDKYKAPKTKAPRSKKSSFTPPLASIPAPSPAYIPA